MAVEEKEEGVFFMFLDQLHKILKDRNVMVDIFAIRAKGKPWHQGQL